MRILIVEDDLIIGKNVETALKEEGFSVVLKREGISGGFALKQESFDCIILDINLPGKSGIELCREFRQVDKHTPVLLLTAFDELEDKVQGFESGADDYLTKPFFMKELSLRIHSLVKRKLQNGAAATDQNELEFGDLQLNLREKRVTRGGKEIMLTPREFQILQLLVERDGALVSKKELVKEIWGSSFDHNTNTIEVYVNFLRNKIDKPFNTGYIKTRIGFGYYMDKNAGS